VDSRAPVIEIRALRIERDAVILDRIDWRVEAGQHWVILGANGSGKTSMLSALTGYLAPTAGEISVLGETYGRSDWRDLRTRIGIVSSAIVQMMPPHERVLDTIISGRRAMIGLWGETVDDDRARASEIIRQVEAENVAESRWGWLSQGERQRILIGRALMARPELLILDEPCAGLDPVARERFLGFLDRLAAAGASPALVLVTHHVEEIMPKFSHALVLKSGRVLAAGAKSSVMKSKILSDAFGAPVKVSRRGDRYALRVTTDAKLVV